MTAAQFNEKYKGFIEPGFEDQGLEFDNEKVTLFLDNIFKDLTKIPGFQYSQIKLKFGSCRFYTTLNSVLSFIIEDNINSIIRQQSNE
jgi:hypothetical protein